ncbi:hypothetical protein EC988_002793 [Linderina pennispora]|nr:hypothetical protein EC988_002793 [Linderina pennispora]
MPNASRKRRRRQQTGNQTGGPVASSSSSSSPPLSAAATPAPPRAIPGFVYDAEKKRYFPITSRAANAVEQRAEQREKQRVERIARKQQQEKKRHSSMSQWSRPAILRHRAALAVPATAANCWLRFAGMQATRQVRHHNQRSPITALFASAVPNGSTILYAGRRNGAVTPMGLTAEGEVDSAFRNIVLSGPVTSIQELRPSALLLAAMGNSNSAGGLTVYSTNPADAAEHPPLSHTYPDASVFCASRLTDAASNRVAVGLTEKAVVSTVSSTRIHDIFDATTGSDILSTCFLDSKSLFACGGRDGRIRLFDVRLNAKKQNRTRGLLSSDDVRHASCVYAVSFCQDLLVTAGTDNAVRLWDIRMPKAWDESMMYSQQRQSVLAVHQRPTVRNVGTISCQTRAAVGLGLWAHNDVIAAASVDNMVQLWRLPGAEPLCSFSLPAAGGPCTAIHVGFSRWSVPTTFAAQGDNVFVFSHRPA